MGIQSYLLSPQERKENTVIPTLVCYCPHRERHRSGTISGCSLMDLSLGCRSRHTLETRSLFDGDRHLPNTSHGGPAQYYLSWRSVFRHSGATAFLDLFQTMLPGDACLFGLHSSNFGFAPKHGMVRGNVLQVACVGS